MKIYIENILFLVCSITILGITSCSTSKISSANNGFENIFDDLKTGMENIEMLPDNRIDATKYDEKAIIETLKKMGYEYKKAIGNKLHFFNKETSVSLYLLQGKKIISLIP